MKVTREKGTFRPITIMLETEVEADAVWKAMNKGGEDGFPLDLWRVFDGVYRPEEEKDC